jgi:hypothetical protein
MAITRTVTIVCDLCSDLLSNPYTDHEITAWHNEQTAIDIALELGWRIWRTGRTTHVECPNCLIERTTAAS